jgi:hypothetical protein
MENSALTSAGLKHLAGLKNLKWLYIHGTKMYGAPERDKLLEELRQALPKCTVSTFGY